MGVIRREYKIGDFFPDADTSNYLYAVERLLRIHVCSSYPLRQEEALEDLAGFWGQEVSVETEKKNGYTDGYVILERDGIKILVGRYNNGDLSLEEKPPTPGEIEKIRRRRLKRKALSGTVG